MNPAFGRGAWAFVADYLSSFISGAATVGAGSSCHGLVLELPLGTRSSRGLADCAAIATQHEFAVCSMGTGVGDIGERVQGQERDSERGWLAGCSASASRAGKNRFIFGNVLIGFIARRACHAVQWQRSLQIRAHRVPLALITFCFSAHGYVFRTDTRPPPPGERGRFWGAQHKTQHTNKPKPQTQPKNRPTNQKRDTLFWGGWGGCAKEKQTVL